MRAALAMALVLGSTALLAACGKQQNEAPVMPSTPPLNTESAAPAASETPAQQKIVAALPAPFNAGDPVAGQDKFAQCRSCHAVAKGAPNLTGPNLWGVFGQKAGQVEGFTFSDGLKNASLTMDAPTLDKWIENPRQLVPDTKMTFNGIKDAKDRQDIIAFLATQTDQ
jgi:cytochrome c